MDINSKELTDEEIEDMNSYHPPNADKTQRYKNINDATKKFIKAISVNAPKSADRSTAIRDARQARLWANSAIANDGKF